MGRLRETSVQYFLAEKDFISSCDKLYLGCSISAVEVLIYSMCILKFEHRQLTLYSVNIKFGAKFIIALFSKVILNA
jgi:hypothetical protein